MRQNRSVYLYINSYKWARNGVKHMFFSLLHIIFMINFHETLDLGPHPPTRGVVPQPRELPGLGEAATAVCSQCEEANVSSPPPKNNDKNGQKIWEK